MKLSRFSFCTIALGIIFAAGLRAQPESESLPPVPKMISPVNEFRKLLAMEASEVEEKLASRPEENRSRIAAKIEEYRALPEAVRESRLQATHLQYLLTPLMLAEPGQREALLQTIPDEDVVLVRSRLSEWERLAPEVQRETLDQPTTLRWFFRNESSGGQPDTSQINPYTAARTKEREDLSRGNRFTSLKLSKQLELLDPRNYTGISEMEIVLREIEKLPEEQRLRCLESLAVLTAMSPEQRNRFVENVTRWQSMSPETKRTWSRLVPDISRIMPPAIRE